MKIDGKQIALEIYDGLKFRVEKLKEQGIAPQIAVILIGDDPASKSYITQKERWSKYIGTLFSYIHFPENASEEEVLDRLKLLNSDPKIHGIIVQRPIPAQINKQKIINTINLKKDIDGFHPDSIYDVPVAQAVMRVLTKIHSLSKVPLSETQSGSMIPYNSRNAADYPNTIFLQWLKHKSIVVIGKGETAGKPIISHLKKNGLNPHIISSQTLNPLDSIKKADIIISAVGKSEIVKPAFLKPDAIVLGVGLYRGENDKLYGDYIASDIELKASYYTPIIGGIGPVNVAYLLSNLIDAAEKAV